MASDIQTKLSLSGQKLLLGQAGRPPLCTPAHVNQRLARIRSAADCRLGNGVISMRHIHVGPGAYAAGSRTGFHRHECLQVEFVLAGCFVFEDEEGTCDLESGVGLVIKPNRSHRWSCVQEESLMLGLLIDVVGLGDVIDAIAPGSSMRRIDQTDLAAGLTALMEVLPIDDLFAEARREHALGAWFAALLSALWPHGMPGQHNPVPHQHSVGIDSDERLCLAVEAFLDLNCTNRICLDDVALEVGISVRHMNRIFRRRRQQSVGAALVDCQLRQAHALLEREPDLSIKAIAARCGFSSASYFSARFRCRYGRPPGAVRRLA